MLKQQQINLELNIYKKLALKLATNFIKLASKHSHKKMKDYDPFPRDYDQN